MSAHEMDASGSTRKPEEDRPYFVWWNQDLTEADIVEALAGDNLYRRVTYMSYILNDAEFEDVWKFLTLDDIRRHFWQIRWRNEWTRERWKQLLNLLGAAPDECADPIAARILG